MGKPHGWMDTDHGPAKRFDEAQLVDAYRLLTKKQRDTVMGMIDELVELNTAAGATLAQGDEVRSPAQKKPPH